MKLTGQAKYYRGRVLQGHLVYGVADARQPCSFEL